MLATALNVQSESEVDLGDEALDGMLRHVVLLGDLVVRVAGGEEFEDFGLAWRELALPACVLVR
jgi:hypothetical protein